MDTASKMNSSICESSDIQAFQMYIYDKSTQYWPRKNNPDGLNNNA